MDNDTIKKKCHELLSEFGQPSFIVFGWQKSPNQYGVVYAKHKMPSKVMVKSMSWALHDASQKML